MTIWTIGHSTRPASEFLALLDAHGIKEVADVRAVPASRRHPQFGRERLRTLLESHGVAYRHMPALGGHRQPRLDSPNGAWRESAFRGYADHLDTAEFRAGLQKLLESAAKCPVSLMCAEARWNQCHRQLIADVLVVGGHEVRHIMSLYEPERHELSGHARVGETSITSLTYPSLLQPRPGTPARPKT